jgi:hypothetical protein
MNFDFVFSKVPMEQLELMAHRDRQDRQVDIKVGIHG